MRKQYAIIGILVLLLVSALIAYSTSSTQVDKSDEHIRALTARLALVEEQLASVGSGLVDTESELVSTESELVQVEEQLASTESELAQLEDIVNLREFIFNDSLCVFEVNASWYNRYMDIMSGKVQNVSTEQVEKVCIFVISYDEDGSLVDVDKAYAYGLYPQEISEWGVRIGKLEGAASYAIYAFGNK